MPPLFPHPEDFARAFYQEGVRHLRDAHCLHGNGAWAGAVTSAMKAGELGAKSVLIQHNAMGIYDKVFNTHKPYTEIESHPILKRLLRDLDTYRPKFSLEVREMEQLEPNLFGKRNFEAGEANTEYPFLTKETDAAGNIVAIIKSPEQFFDRRQSERYCRIAHDLLGALCALYPTVASWNIPLPPRI